MILHKELGAYLIAVGQLMIQKNQSVGEVADNIENDSAIAEAMMKNGIRGEIATEIAQKRGHAFVRQLQCRRTFADLNEQQAHYAEYEGDDEDDGDSDDEDEKFEKMPTRAEVETWTASAIAEFFGESAFKRMRHYNLTLADIADDEDSVYDFWQFYESNVRELSGDDVPDWSPMTFDKLVDCIFADQAQA